MSETGSLVWPVEKASAVSMVSHEEFWIATVARDAQTTRIADCSALMPSKGAFRFLRMIKKSPESHRFTPGRKTR